MVRRTGAEALFAVALDPTRAGSEREVMEVSAIRDEVGGCVVHVTLADGVEEAYAYNPEGRQREVEGILTDSRLLCLRRGPGAAAEKVAEAEPLTVE